MPIGLFEGTATDAERDGPKLAINPFWSASVIAVWLRPGQ